MAAQNTGEPGYPPASKAIQASAAVNLPFLSAPILTRTNDPGVGPVPSKQSARVMMILTGCPVLRESSAANRLQVDRDLAAEAAADLLRHHLDLLHRNVEHGP